MATPIPIKSNPTQRDMVDELREVAGAKQEVLTKLPQVKLGRQQRQILTLLMSRDQVHRQVMYAVLYNEKPVADRPDPRTLDTVISVLRKLLHPWEVTIDRVEEFWMIPPESKIRIKDMIHRTQSTPLQTVYTIEKHILMPSKGQRSIPYPFDQMEVGDSFLCTDKFTRLSNSVKNYKRRPDGQGKNFAIRKVEGGVRCWRIE